MFFVTQLAPVDEALISLRAGDGDFGAVGNVAGGVTAAHHGGNAQFAGDDGRVAGAATAIGDDCRCPLHHRFPVRVSHVGHQHIAGLNQVHFLDACNDTGNTGADPLPDAAPGAQYLRVFLERESNHGLARPALHGLRPRLQDEQFARPAVLAPFDIHGLAIVLLDGDGLSGERMDFLVRQREPAAVLIGHGHRCHAFFAPVGVDHLDGLAAQVAPYDGVVPTGQRRLVHIELVRVHCALDDGFAQAIARGNQDQVPETGFRIQREQDPGTSQVGPYHALHAHRQRHLAVIESLMNPVGDGPVVEQRSVDAMNAGDDVVKSRDVEQRILLTGEGCLRKVLGRGRRAHRNADVLTVGQLFPCGADGISQVRRQRRAEDHLPDPRTGMCQRGRIVHVQVVQEAVDGCIQAVLSEELRECVGSGRKALRYPNAELIEVPDHLAQRRVLAAHAAHVSAAAGREADDIFFHAILPCHRAAVDSIGRANRIFCVGSDRCDCRDAWAQSAYTVR